MPFHLAAFMESVDNGGAFGDVAALLDQRLNVIGDNIRVPALDHIVAIGAGVDAVVAPRARLYSPSIEQLARYEIAEINTNNAAAAVYGNPQRLVDLRRNPLVVVPDENLRAEILANPAAAQLQFVHVWFADGPITPAENLPVHTVRLTGATTVTAAAWSAVPLTLDDELPNGTYAIVGARFQGATCIAGRINFLGGDQSWRPGAPGSVLVSDMQYPIFRNGGMGVWGQFPTTQLPQAEFLCNDADTAQVVYLDVVRVA